MNLRSIKYHCHHNHIPHCSSPLTPHSSATAVCTMPTWLSLNYISQDPLPIWLQIRVGQRRKLLRRSGLDKQVQSCRQIPPCFCSPLLCIQLFLIAPCWPNSTCRSTTKTLAENHRRGSYAEATAFHRLSTSFTVWFHSSTWHTRLLRFNYTLIYPLHHCFRKADYWLWSANSPLQSLISEFLPQIPYSIIQHFSFPDWTLTNATTQTSSQSFFFFK